MDRGLPIILVKVSNLVDYTIYYTDLSSSFVRRVSILILAALESISFRISNLNGSRLIK